MNPRNPKIRHVGSTAATLLVAYMLVLQAIAAGVVTNARGAALFSDAICLSKVSGSVDGAPDAPIRPSRHGDACCVIHCAAFGGGAAPSPFIGETPPALSYVAAKRAFEHAPPNSDPATPPLGSRAPPVTI
jgi:hypothetical protein